MNERRPPELARIPEHTVSRLSFYLRGLSSLEEAGVLTVSSEDLAERFGVNAAQIRKDLAYFGEFGTRGVGYRVPELREHLRTILGLNKVWNVGLFGFGNLGRALVSYRGFEPSGFRIVAIFDIAEQILALGSYQGIPIYPFHETAQRVGEHAIHMAILAVPAEFAQDTGEMIVYAGVQALLNFAPVTLRLPPEAKVRYVDLTVNLENLSFFLAGQQGASGTPD